MAAVYRVLGQAVAPVGTTTGSATAVSDNLSNPAVISTIHVTSLTDNQVTYYLYVVKSGGSASTANAYAYGATITGRDVHEFTSGVTLAAGDRIYASCSAATSISVQVFGSELA